jgi:hypothetical protein
MTPGFVLRPSKSKTTHVFAPALPLGPCGHGHRAWLSLDVTADPVLAPKLPGWTTFFATACTDCGAWMRRHDLRVDDAGAILELEVEPGDPHAPFDDHATRAIAPVHLKLVKATRKLEDEPLGGHCQLGGDPAWIQKPTDVHCPGCETKMTFVARLSSPNGFEDEPVIPGESGALYTSSLRRDFVASSVRHLEAARQRSFVALAAGLGGSRARRAAASRISRSGREHRGDAVRSRLAAAASDPLARGRPAELVAGRDPLLGEALALRIPGREHRVRVVLVGGDIEVDADLAARRVDHGHAPVQLRVGVRLVPGHHVARALEERLEVGGVQRLRVLLVAPHRPWTDQHRLGVAVAGHRHRPALVVLVLVNERRPPFTLPGA